MGVKNLWDILESCKQTLPLHHLQNKRLCVDLSCWMIQLQNASKSQACAREKLYLRNLFHRLRALIALNCSLIFVTDGSIPALKLSTYRRRLGSSSEVTQDETTSHAVASLPRNMGSEFSCMIKEAKLLGMSLGIPCLDGIEEAEAQCALLNSANICDGCFSADSDIFLFGARTVYRDIFLGDGGHVVCYEMVDIERKLGFGRNSLITLALLLGCDYSQGLHGFGPETACQIVKSLGDAHVLHQVLSEGFKFTRKTKQTKQKTKAPKINANEQHCQDKKQNSSAIENKQDPGLNIQFQKVVDAYLKPKCHSPDSELVDRVCAQHPFHRSQLQQICSRFFGWDPEKTDQYILPKIAERDLRRFANLRATSQTGTQIPLEKMPVSCPVSAIVKQRKVQGTECFEVSWQEIDGLNTSIVPADLMQSACPEKITEFVEMRVERKKEKRKPRPRKSDKATIREVDLQLQGLLLNIVLESNRSNQTAYSHLATTNIKELETIDLSSPSPPIRACKIAKHRETIKHHIDEIATDLCKFESNESIPVACGHLATVNNTEPEIIDLLSPSPIHACKVASHRETIHKCINDITVDLSKYELDISEEHQENAEGGSTCKDEQGRDLAGTSIDVIDVLDSDTDVSPEHRRKAIDLRLFIDNIQRDLS